MAKQRLRRNDGVATRLAAYKKLWRYRKSPLITWVGAVFPDDEESIPDDVSVDYEHFAERNDSAESRLAKNAARKSRKRAADTNGGDKNGSPSGKKRKYMAWTAEEDEKLRLAKQEHGVILDFRQWVGIAEKVPGRTARQVRERWLNSLDPTLKKGKWSQEEEETLIRLQAEMGNRWALIEKYIPGRSAWDVGNHWSHMNRAKNRSQAKNSKVSEPEGSEAVQDTSEVVNEDVESPERSSKAPGKHSLEDESPALTKTSDEHMQALLNGSAEEKPLVPLAPRQQDGGADENPTSSKSGVKRNKVPWSDKEDELLCQAVGRLGLDQTDYRTGWTAVSELLPGRTSKQAKERWMNHLDPSRNTDPWTESEIESLFQLREELGNHWTKIALRFPGRSATQVRNRWYVTKKSQEARAKKQEKDKAQTQEYSTASHVSQSPADVQDCPPASLPRKPAAAASGRRKGRKKRVAADSLDDVNKRDSKKKRTRWSSSEDESLSKIMKEVGFLYTNDRGEFNWVEIAKMIPGRTARQVKKRWTTRLDPSASDTLWSQAEDSMLFTLHSEFGSQWQVIAKYLPGRSAADAMNRWDLCQKVRRVAAQQQQQRQQQQAEVFHSQPQLPILPRPVAVQQPVPAQQPVVVQQPVPVHRWEYAAMPNNVQFVQNWPAPW